MEVWLSDGLGCHLSRHFCPFLQGNATQEPGKVAEAVEDRKCEKYMGLPPGHFFSPVAIKTLGQLARSRWPYLKNWGAASEQRQVSRSPESICSNGSLWQFSGELYLSAGEHSLVCDNFYLTNFILLLFIYLLLN